MYLVRLFLCLINEDLQLGFAYGNICRLLMFLKISLPINQGILVFYTLQANVINLSTTITVPVSAEQFFALGRG